jgi:hypothetical protein
MASDRGFSRDENKAIERRSRTSHESEAAPAAGDALHPLLNLQRQIGNARVARMLAQRQPASVQRAAEEDEDELQMKRDPQVQRAAEEDEDEVQMKRDAPEVGLEGGPISDQLAGRIQARRGSGAALDERTRTPLEQSFGASFEDVRVHTDTESGAINRSLGAKAFTTGSDIFFGEGAHPGDSQLLAHELTHVVQQRSMSGGGSGGMHVGPAGDSYEREADSMAAAVTTGPASAQRKEEE